MICDGLQEKANFKCTVQYYVLCGVLFANTYGTWYPPGDKSVVEMMRENPIVKKVAGVVSLYRSLSLPVA
jgi:hypothetical protein